MGNHLSVCGVGISLPDSYGLNATNCTLVAAHLLKWEGAYEGCIYCEASVSDLDQTSSLFCFLSKGFYTTQSPGTHMNTHTKINGQLVPGYDHVVLATWTRAQQISLISLTKAIHLFLRSDLLVQKQTRLLYHIISELLICAVSYL